MIQHQSLLIRFLFCIAVVGGTGVACRRSPPIDNIIIGPVLTSPVWHPNGKMIGFLHALTTPITSTSISSGSISPPFGVINQDGTDEKLLTNFTIYNAAWSPDGKWIAYSDGNNLYTMPFNMEAVDSGNRIQLTSKQKGAFDLTWSDDSKSTYFTINAQIAGVGGVFKVNIGSLQIDTIAMCDNEIGFMSYPFLFKKDYLLFSQVKNGKTEFVIIDTLSQLKQVINVPVEAPTRITQPQYFNDRIYFGADGIWSMNLDGTGVQRINNYSYYGFSVSKQGQIAYTHLKPVTDYPSAAATDSLGQLWLMQMDGSLNHYITISR